MSSFINLGGLIFIHKTSKYFTVNPPQVLRPHSFHEMPFLSFWQCIFCSISFQAIKCPLSLRLRVFGPKLFNGMPRANNLTSGICTKNPEFSHYIFFTLIRRRTYFRKLVGDMDKKIPIDCTKSLDENVIGENRVLANSAKRFT